MDELEALKAITINPAEALRIANRKGALAAGMDADIVVWAGHPLDFRTRTERVYIQGVLQYDANREGVLK